MYVGFLMALFQDNVGSILKHSAKFVVVVEKLEEFILTVKFKSIPIFDSCILSVIYKCNCTFHTLIAVSCIEGQWFLNVTKLHSYLIDCTFQKLWKLWNCSKYTAYHLYYV